MFQRPTVPDIYTEYLVIGAGVAGITLAQKLKESGLEVWLLGSQYESQIAKAGALQNVSLIPEGTIGLDHIEEMIDKAKEVGVKHKTSLCTGIDINGDITVKTKSQKFIAKKVIIATGAKQPRLNFEGEKEFYQKGISDCAVCDGRLPLFKGRDIAVVGNHEYTRRAAEFMKQLPGSISSNVYLLWLSNQPDFNLENIIIFTNVKNINATGSDVLGNVSFDSDQGSQTLQISGLFVEGKPYPATKFLQNSKIELNETGYVVIDSNFKTNINNIWAIGDVTGLSDSYDSALKHAIELSNEFTG